MIDLLLLLFNKLAVDFLAKHLYCYMCTCNCVRVVLASRLPSHNGNGGQLSGARNGKLMSYVY